MALELPTELLVVVATHADAPTFVAMQATCKTWLDAVRAAGAQVTDRLWHAFALARFPRAAAIVKHATGPVAGYTLYRAQLQADRAEYLPVAPLPPCKTQFGDYLFALECVWPAGADGEPRVGRWSGVVGAPASTECPLWDEGAAPAWHREWIGSVRSSSFPEEPELRVHVTNLRTLQCILLCDDTLPTDGWMWITLPTTGAMRLSEEWDSQHSVAQINPTFADDSTWRVIVLEFDTGQRAEDDASLAPQTMEYERAMTPGEVLRYLEHHAPWHLSGA